MLSDCVSAGNEMMAIRFHSTVLCLSLLALAGCSMMDDYGGEPNLPYPNINLQAVERPMGLKSPQQSQAEIAALERLRAEHAEEAEQEIEGKQ